MKRVIRLADAHRKAGNLVSSAGVIEAARLAEALRAGPASSTACGF